MSKLNNFRLHYNTALLLVLSHEYDIPFAQLIGLYNISEKMFLAYLAVFANMSKMGVRKGNQLAKIANKIHRSVHGIKDKTKRKVEYTCVDDEGNVIMQEDGTPKIEKHIVTEYVPIVLDEKEARLKTILLCYSTKGYSNGENFYTDKDLLNMHIINHRSNDHIKIDGELYNYCSRIEFIVEKYFPDMTLEEYRKLSIKDVEKMLEQVSLLEEQETETEVEASVA